MAAPANRLVIGLDYGTTYTGVAFQAVGQAENYALQIVQDWPHSGNEVKVPSEISYTPPLNGEAQWGGHFSANSVKLVWTKLEFDTQQRSEELRLILQALNGTGNLDFGAIQQTPGLLSYPARDEVEIVADYLEKVRIVLWKNLINIFGEFTMETMPIDLVFTVPAAWSEFAKNRTFRAISKAGFDRNHFRCLREVVMISEPEATSLHFLKSLRPLLGERKIQPEDSFVLCDAGGGTVDLISYRLRQVQPTFEIEEITSVTGDYCGATFINAEFRRWLKRRLGKPNFQRLVATSSSHGNGSHNIIEPGISSIMFDFELVKRQFEGVGTREDKYIRLPPPLNLHEDPDNGITDGEIRVSEHDMKDFFQFSVKRTIELISGQIASADFAGLRVKHVFLSGGFAESVHLFNEIQQFFSATGVTVHRQESPWSSVVKGAVAWGVDANSRSMIYARKCRKHYGISVSQPFSQFKHSEPDSYFDPYDDEKKAKDQMIWLIKKGDAILSSAPKHASINISRKFGRRDPRIFRTLLVSSDDDTAHQRLADVPNKNRVVTPITYDFTNISENQLTRVRGIGRREDYLVVNFEIEINLQTNVEVRVTCNGTEMRKETLNYT